MERKLLISDLEIEYDGLFDAADFLKLIDDWCKQNGYDKDEIKHTEKVSEKGKTIDIEIMPNKEINEYTKYEIYVKIGMKNLTEKKIKKKDQEFRINKGNISVVIDVFLATDIKHRMESKPLYFFIRTIFNKFLHKEYIDRYEKELMKDVKDLHTELKSYLNLQRYSEQA